MTGALWRASCIEWVTPARQHHLPMTISQSSCPGKRETRQQSRNRNKRSQVATKGAHLGQKTPSTTAPSAHLWCSLMRTAKYHHNEIRYVTLRGNLTDGRMCSSQDRSCEQSHQPCLSLRAGILPLINLTTASPFAISCVFTSPRIFTYFRAFPTNLSCTSYDQCHNCFFGKYAFSFSAVVCRDCI